MTDPYRNWVAIPDLQNGYSAHQNGATVVMQSDYWHYPGLLAHEATHALDLLKLGNNSGYWSFGPEWQAAVAADVAIATDYAANNYIEAFAEIGRLVLYDINVPGGLNSINPTGLSQIRNQVNLYEQLLRSEATKGGRCTARVASSAAVPMTNNPKARALGAKPSTKLSGEVPEIPVPVEVYDLPINVEPVPEPRRS